MDGTGLERHYGSWLYDVTTSAQMVFGRRFIMDFNAPLINISCLSQSDLNTPFLFPSYFMSYCDYIQRFIDIQQHEIKYKIFDHVIPDQFLNDYDFMYCSELSFQPNTALLEIDVNRYGHIWRHWQKRSAKPRAMDIIYMKQLQTRISYSELNYSLDTRPSNMVCAECGIGNFTIFNSQMIERSYCLSWYHCAQRNDAEHKQCEIIHFKLETCSEKKKNSNVQNANR